MRITWDERKRRANLAKHGLDLARVDEDFFVGAVVQPAKVGRYKALGRIDGLAVAVIFRPLGAEAFAIISLRPTSARERQDI